MWLWREERVESEKEVYSISDLLNMFIVNYFRLKENRDNVMRIINFIISN